MTDFASKQANILYKYGKMPNNARFDQDAATF
jgi:hypothetical protein